MAASRVPATLARLHQLWTAEMALPGALNVWLGRVATDDPSDALFVGWDGDIDGDDRMAATQTTWAGIGANKRNEAIAIPCSLLMLRGLGSEAGGVAALVTEVYALHDTAEAALRVDPSLGQGPPYMAAMSQGDLFMHSHTEGLLARLAFTVTVQTRN